MDYGFIVRVTLQPGDPRVCDYCNKLLVDEEGFTVEECFSTDHGLVCRRCLGGMVPFSSHQKGEDVKETFWYKG
ncbi:MAG: hypothetical protein GF350_04915 [Chitinivibrionales bacterium]|nr:hypothetical protein [Chitinivibrionales bacterium]